MTESNIHPATKSMSKKQLILTPSATSINKSINVEISELKSDINELQQNIKCIIETINTIESNIKNNESETISVLKNHTDCIKQICKIVNVEIDSESV